MKANYAQELMPTFERNRDALLHSFNIWNHSGYFSKSKLSQFEFEIQEHVVVNSFEE